MVKEKRNKKKDKQEKNKVKKNFLNECSIVAK